MKCAAENLKESELTNKWDLQCRHKCRGLYIYVSGHADAKYKEGSACTEYEFHTLAYKFILSDGTQYNLLFKNMEFIDVHSIDMQTRF